MGPGDATPDVELIAASLRADRTDLGVFLDVLVAKLTDILPEAVVVTSGSGMFRRDKRARAVALTLGERRFTLTRTGGTVSAEISHEVRGVRLSGDQVELDAWLTELARGLADEATRSAAARNALAQLLS
ncbi:MAG TPA: hypothetical protein VNE21_07855 [Mycobacteriales bacterium]|nr:hypothetical protein [Mycobacteriales bacterium]